MLADDLAAAAAELGERLDALEGSLLVLGALVRQFRTERGLSTRQLATRSTLARSTVTRLEAGQLYPRRSALVVLAAGIDPDHCREILDQLVAAAGPSMAVDTPGWRRYRRRRTRRGLLAGMVPMPATERRRAELRQVAAATARRAVALRGSS